jgi:AhpD family alkylhydroperoxidase
MDRSPSARERSPKGQIDIGNAKSILAGLGRPIETNVNERRPDSFLVQIGDFVMKPRMKNPAFVVPEALPALLAVGKAARQAGVPQRTLELVELRVSQINACSLCVDMHARDLKKAGETDQRLFALAAWREAPFFTDAERAALALAEAATRLNDRADPVSDETWNEAARHFDEAGLASLVLNIGIVNLWNRVNVTTRQVAGSLPG